MLHCRHGVGWYGGGIMGGGPSYNYSLLCPVLPRMRDTDFAPSRSEPRVDSRSKNYPQSVRQFYMFFPIIHLLSRCKQFPPYAENCREKSYGLFFSIVVTQCVYLFVILLLLSLLLLPLLQLPLLIRFFLTSDYKFQVSISLICFLCLITVS